MGYRNRRRRGCWHSILRTGDERTLLSLFGWKFGTMADLDAAFDALLAEANNSEEERKKEKKRKKKEEEEAKQRKKKRERSPEPEPGKGKKMIEIICNDRLGNKVRVKCHAEETIGNVKKIVAAQSGHRA